MRVPGTGFRDGEESSAASHQRNEESSIQGMHDVMLSGTWYPEPGT